MVLEKDGRAHRPKRAAPLRESRRRNVLIMGATLKGWTESFVYGDMEAENEPIHT